MNGACEIVGRVIEERKILGKKWIDKKYER
jgi:hypothetical protein